MEPRDRGEADIGTLVDEEQRSWAELQALLSSLTTEQAERPGYFIEGWSAKDLLAHIAGWLAEAGLVLEQIRVGTFTGRDVDIDAMNAAFLEANRPEPMIVVHTEAYGARTRLMQEVGHLVDGNVTPSAEVWLRKAGPEHYAEHLPRLRAWVTEQRG